MEIVEEREDKTIAYFLRTVDHLCNPDIVFSVCLSHSVSAPPSLQQKDLRGPLCCIAGLVDVLLCR